MTDRPPQAEADRPPQAEAGRPSGAEPARPSGAEAARPSRAKAARPPQAEAGRPLRADARRNREQVLAAAREAFAATGFGVPLDEIAARAGVGPGTVYRHFPTKEALFEAVITARLEDLITDLSRRLEDDDPGAAFFGFLTRLRDEASAKRDMPDALAVPGALRDELGTALGELLARAQDAGAVRPGIQIPDLIRLLKGAFASINDQSAGPPTPQTTNLVFTILSDGLRPPR